MPVVVAVVVVGVQSGAGASLKPPFYRWGRSAVSGTRTAGNSCGRCGYTAVSYTLLPCPHDR